MRVSGVRKVVAMKPIWLWTGDVRGGFGGRELERGEWKYHQCSRHVFEIEGVLLELL